MCSFDISIYLYNTSPYQYMENNNSQVHHAPSLLILNPIL